MVQEVQLVEPVNGSVVLLVALLGVLLEVPLEAQQAVQQVVQQVDQQEDRPEDQMVVESCRRLEGCRHSHPNRTQRWNR